MTRKTDISVFIPNLDVGGAELSMLEIAEGLAARGLIVDLVLIEAKGEFMKHISNNIRVVNLASRRTRYSIWKLYRYLKKERPKGLISSHDGANVIAILAKFLSRVPTHLIITINSHLSSAYNTNNDHRLAKFNVLALFKILKFAYQYADEIVAISEGVADDLARITKILKKQIRIFYLPVLTDRFYKLKSQSIENPSLFAKDVPNILSVGRLTAAKDFATLIRAFSIVVKYVPFVNNCYPYMKECDLFVVSSAWEGLSMVLIEAMACGVPVVSTDCDSGPREILEGGSWGRLVPVGDHEAMAEAIKKTLTEGPRPVTVVPDYVLDPFRQDIVARKYQQLIPNNGFSE
jgi:glycosyltransferase involved in cell wall biosynthesis